MAGGGSKKFPQISISLLLLILVVLILFQRYSFKRQLEDLKSNLNLEKFNALSLQNQIMLTQAAAAEERAQTTADIAPFVMRTYSNSEFSFSVEFPNLWNYREEKSESGPLKFSVVINSPAGYYYFIEIYELGGKQARDFVANYYAAQGYKVLDLREENLAGRRVLKFYTEHSSKDVNGVPYAYGNVAFQRGDYLFNLSSSRGKTPQEKVNNPFLTHMASTLRLE